MKSTIALVVASLALGTATGASAAPITFFGSGSSTANANDAYDAWKAAVSSFSVDQLGGLAGTQGASANLASSAGSVFRTTDDYAFVGNGFGGGSVIEGRYLEVDREGPLATFTWRLPTASNAFGFFSNDLDGGTLTIAFTDGTSQSFTRTTASGGDENSFWGIANLTSQVALVSISTNDGPGISYYDRFAYGQSKAVPLPATLALLGLGMAGLAWVRRRQIAA